MDQAFSTTPLPRFPVSSSTSGRCPLLRTKNEILINRWRGMHIAPVGTPEPPYRCPFGLQGENVFVVLSGQIQHGPVKRHEYHPLAHSQAEQVGIRNLTISGVTTLPVFAFTRYPRGVLFSRGEMLISDSGICSARWRRSSLTAPLM